MSSTKISLPAFIKMLTNGQLAPAKAMAIAGKMLVRFPLVHVHAIPD